MADASCSYDRDACEYTLDYGHGTKTQGDLSVETLTLDSISGSVISFSKIVIGCAHTNTQGFEYNGKSSGIVGLGKGPITSNLSSKLNFGDAATVSGDKVVSTPMVKMIGNQQKDYYYLTLKAFSVGNKRIKYKGFKREGTNASTNNIIIDSGTPVSLLPRHVFHKLESAVKKVIKLERFQDPTDSFSLCYNTTSKKLNFPVITAHFSGADVKLDPKGVFSTIFKGIECFAFRPHNNGLGLFGSMAQMNHLIGHDLKRNIVSFKPTDCSFLEVVSRNVRCKVKPALGTKQVETEGGKPVKPEVIVDQIMDAWARIASSPRKELYVDVVFQFWKICEKYLDLLKYVESTILDKVKEKFVCAWTDKV
ncbi:aspartic proteinase CDR1-like [Vicia villosa]|uniref:aspartic proteinase CDR1-like n=1 Tax=Vicia villosa TaxID=3911 RepID=UPI00273BD60D|nr:aspartic proteinase CDR1-like [Vicia villosa]